MPQVSLRTGKPSRFQRRGFSLMFIGVAIVVLVGLASLAADFGLVQIAKSELQTAVDASARAAAGSLPSVSAAQTAATSIASQNRYVSHSLTLDPTTEIEFVSWDESTGSYSVLTGGDRSNANAVRISVERAIPLQLARLIGITSSNVRVSAIAMMNDTSYGVIGLEYIKMSGNSSNSYYSEDGSTPTQFGKKGNVASNGDITLSGSSSINGNARPGIGKQVIGASAVTGSTAPLNYVLSYPVGDAGIYKTQNDNGNIPNANLSASSFSLGKNKDLTLPGGNYYFNYFSTGAGSELNFTGPTTIYVYGDVSLGGKTKTSADLPQNLRIITVPSPWGGPAGTIEIGGTSALHADIYAPQNRIRMTGTGDIYGSVLGRSIDMTGTSAIHFDRSLLTVADGIVLVR